MSGTIFLGGNLALRYSRNTRLLRRRRVLLGAVSVIWPVRSYLGMRAVKQVNDIREDHPAYRASTWTISVLANEEICKTIQRLRYSSVPPELIKTQQNIEQRYLNREPRGKLICGSCIRKRSLTSLSHHQTFGLVYLIALASFGPRDNKEVNY